MGLQFAAAAASSSHNHLTPGTNHAGVLTGPANHQRAATLPLDLAGSADGSTGAASAVSALVGAAAADMTDDCVRSDPAFEHDQPLKLDSDALLVATGGGKDLLNPANFLNDQDSQPSQRLAVDSGLPLHPEHVSGSDETSLQARPSPPFDQQQAALIAGSAAGPTGAVSLQNLLLSVISRGDASHLR